MLSSFSFRYFCLLLCSRLAEFLFLLWMVVAATVCTGSGQRFTARPPVHQILMMSSALNAGSHAAWLWLVKGTLSP